jgi:signal recognition particle subunit SEC65
MSGDASRIRVWTGYFDARLSRSEGRRVSVTNAVPKPDLDSIALAARSLGIRKMKREANQSHPKRPRAREGYLVMSAKDAHSAAGTNSKEELMAAIGSRLSATHQEAKEKAEEERKRGPRKGDRAARSQRKAKRPQNKKNKRRQNRR